MALPQRRPDSGVAGPEAVVDWRSLYQIEDLEAVDADVARNGFLGRLLSRAPAAIAEHFGDHEGLRLDLVTFPDEGDQHLYLYVRAKGDYDGVLRRRERLDDNWWIDAMLDAHGTMTVDLEFA